MENLTIESLAISIHNDEIKACKNIGECSPTDMTTGETIGSFNEASPKMKQLRREQARLMLERWMR